MRCCSCAHAYRREEASEADSTLCYYSFSDFPEPASPQVIRCVDCSASFLLAHHIKSNTLQGHRNIRSTPCPPLERSSQTLLPHLSSPPHRLNSAARIGRSIEIDSDMVLPGHNTVIEHRQLELAIGAGDVFCELSRQRAQDVVARI